MYKQKRNQYIKEGRVMIRSGLVAIKTLRPTEWACTTRQGENLGDLSSYAFYSGSEGKCRGTELETHRKPPRQAPDRVPWDWSWQPPLTASVSAPVLLRLPRWASCRIKFSFYNVKAAFRHKFSAW